MAKRRLSAEPHIPKYQSVIESLSREILSGKYAPGDRFPSEAALVNQFNTSRITIGRALRELTQRGLIERIAGSGSFVRRSPQPKSDRVFGLLIPNLGETEIFEPICQGMSAAPEAKDAALLWGHTAEDGGSRSTQALSLCSQYVDQRVSGVFFAPIESERGADAANQEIVATLERARIPIVLLDRDVVPYPTRSRHDLVGIDNRRAGHMATDYLLSLGVKRIAFLGRASTAPTIAARVAGYREALLIRDMDPRTHRVHLLEGINEQWLHALMQDHVEAVVCGNDRMAGELMHALIAAGVQIPGEVKIVGIDDVEYASLLPVPLTTVHQPCRAIGRAAMMAMLQRTSDATLIARDIFLDVRLVIRSSAGER